MSDDASPSSTGGETVAPDLVAMLSALGSKIRWPIIELLADGTPRSATEVAAVLGRDFDGVSKHLRVMREAGVVACEPGEDRRVLLFSLPAANRRTPGRVDYGVLSVRVATAKLAPAKD